MKRTITMKNNGNVYHHWRYIGYLVRNIQYRFNLEDKHKYIVTIVEGTQFNFSKDRDGDYYLGEESRGDGYIGIICGKTFSNFFFKPDVNKKYDITVTKQ